MSSAGLTRVPKPQIDLIDGAWLEPADVLPATLDDPNTGQVRQHQVATAATDVDRAIARATALHQEGCWAWSSTDTRAELLNRIAAGIDARAEEIAYEDSLANGNALRVSAQMASYLAPRVRSARDQLLQLHESTQLPADGRDVRLLRRPLGPAVVLAPWNAPTFVAVAKVASALAAACPVILKPSEWAPAGCQIVAEVIGAALADMGLPAPVFQLVHGAAAVGAQLASDPRVRAISFTGGGVGGRAVAAAAAPNFTALQLELGGHNPAVVHDDADIELTAAAIAEGMAKLNGQWCEAPGKVLVPEPLHDELVAALLKELGKLTVGRCLDQGTDVGPIAHAAHRDRLQQQIQHLVNQGGRAQTNSTLPELPGWFLPPTVITGLPPEKSVHELFGPVVTVHAVHTLAEGIRAAEGPETGLAGFVFANDLSAALDTAMRLPAGETRINGCKLADLADGSQQSFWGNAGIGGHGPTDMVEFFQGHVTVGVDDPSLPV